MRKEGSKNKATNEKYEIFIKKVYELTQEKQSFEMKSLISEHQVTGSLSNAMIKCKLITKNQDGTYNWCGSYPEKSVIMEVINLVRSKQKYFDEKRKKNLKVQKAINSFYSYKLENLRLEIEKLKKDKKTLIIFSFVIMFFFILSLILKY
jgi:hypothetical protein